MDYGHIYRFILTKFSCIWQTILMKVILLMEGDRVFLNELWQLGVMITGLKVHSGFPSCVTFGRSSTTISEPLVPYLSRGVILESQGYCESEK